MKSQILKNVALTLLLSLLWLTGVSLRSSVIDLKCLKSEQACSKESVLEIDRLSLGMEDARANHYSFLTQNLSGVLALAIPTLWNASAFMLGTGSMSFAILSGASDIVIVLQTASLNGLLTEVAHLIGQRPRPFVYLNPPDRGKDSAHYTSFYSGHTSFSAAALFAAYFILLRRKAPKLLLIPFVILGSALIFSTGYFRVLAGKHFLTDVISGASAGGLVAWIIHLKTKNLDTWSKCS